MVSLASPTNTQHLKHLLIITLLTLVLLLYSLNVYAPCDDAYIFLVYAKNLFSGNGLTFNGDYVQGFSSIAWPWIISLPHLAGFSLPKAMELSSFLSAVFTIASILLVGRKLGLTIAQSIVPALALALTGDFAFYAGNGLEAVLFSGIVLLSASLLWTNTPCETLKKNSTLIILFLAPLIRPEGALIVAIVTGWLTYESRNISATAKLTIKLFLLWAPIIISLRYFYGYWLPNTFYAKSGAGLSNLGQGIQYLWLFSSYYFPITILLVLSFTMKWKALGKAAFPLASIFLLWLSQVTMQGGDNMVGFRAFLAILPLAYLTITYAFRHTQEKYFFTIATAIILYLFYSYNYGTVVASAWNIPVKDHASGWRSSFIERKDTGIWLKENFPQNTTTALSAAGITPYFSGQPTIDMLGLNNTYIALHGKRDRSIVYGHQAGDGEFVMRSAPDVIVLSGGLEPSIFISDREIWADPNFKKNYTPCKATNLTWVWVKKSTLSNIKHHIDCQP